VFYIGLEDACHVVGEAGVAEVDTFLVMSGAR